MPGQELTHNVVTAENPQHILTATQTCSSQSNTFETYLGSQRNLDVLLFVFWDISEMD